MENTNALGKVVKIHRIKRGFGQKQLAELVPCSHQTIGFIEQGRKRPSLEMLGKIAAALGTTPSALFAEAEELNQ